MLRWWAGEVAAVSAARDLSPPQELLTVFESPASADAVELLATRLPRHYYPQRGDAPQRRVTQVLGALGDEQRRAVLVRVIVGVAGEPRRRGHGGYWGTAITDLVLGSLRRRKLNWTDGQLEWLTHFTLANFRSLRRTLGPTVLILVDGLDRNPAAVERVRDEIGGLADRLAVLSRGQTAWEYGDADFAALAGRFAGLAALDSAARRIPDQVLDDRDSFGARAREALLAAVDEATAADFLQLGATYGTATRPTKSWRKQTSAAVDLAPGIVVAARALVQTVVGQPEPLPDEDGWAYNWIDPASETLIRAGLWIVADHADTATTVSLLRDVAAYCAQSARTPGLGIRSLRVTNSAVAALLDRASSAATPRIEPGEAAAALTGVRHRAANRAVTIAVDHAIAEIAAASGVDVNSLLEASVPTFGLDSRGRIAFEVGNYTAVIEARAENGRLIADLSWQNATGKVLVAAPAVVRAGHSERVDELRRVTSDIRKTYPAQQDRIDKLLATHRSWPVAVWQRCYLDHPVVGLVGRSLIWTVQPTRGPAWSGWPTRTGEEWTLTDVDGSVLARAIRGSNRALASPWAHHQRGHGLAELPRRPRTRSAVQTGLPGGIPADTGRG